MNNKTPHPDGPPPDPDELSAEECDALDSINPHAKRLPPGREMDASRLMWEQVAVGAFDPIVETWLAGVAKKILKGFAAPAAQRKDAIFKATGLAGREDRHRELRELITNFEAFDNLDAAGKPPISRTKLRLRLARSLPKYASYDLSDDELRKIIDREMSR